MIWLTPTNKQFGLGVTIGGTVWIGVAFLRGSAPYATELHLEETTFSWGALEC